MKLIEFYSNLKDKIEDDEIVKENFQNIFNKYKKMNSTNKEMMEELEKKFFAGEKMVINKPGKAEKAVKKEKKKVGVKRTYSKMNNRDDDLDSVVSENENNNNVPSSIAKRSRRAPAKKTNKIIDDSEEDGFEEDSEY